MSQIDFVRFFFLVALVAIVRVGAFTPVTTSRQHHQSRQSVVLLHESDDSNKWNPFREVADMFSNMDDVIDDFLFKRMGNGEVFYGERKYKPSGRPNTRGKYNGMGMSDKEKIDNARAYREELEERRAAARQQFDDE